MITAFEVAKHTGGEVIGDGTIELTSLAPAVTARPGDLTFAENDKYLRAAETSAASAVLVAAMMVSTEKTLIRVKNPRVAMARLLPLFFPQESLPPGIHPTAVVAASAQIDPSAHIGPYAVIGEGVKIGAGSSLLGGNHVGRDCQIGSEVCLHPNVVLYPRCRIGHRVTIHAGSVIGSDGYGYVFDEGRHRKVLQVGDTIVEDDVEIGANCAVDRGALGSTVLGKGTKVDNLVHMAHNLTVGKHCLIMGQVGFAGSTVLGDYCVVASQSGVAGHLKIGNQVTIGAKTGVMRDIPDGGVVLGIPAAPDKQAKRQWVATQQLPEFIGRVRALEKRVDALHPEVIAPDE